MSFPFSYIETRLIQAARTLAARGLDMDGAALRVLSDDDVADA